MATGMNRSAVGFWQRLESRFAALLPRQAYVVRTEGSTVWVRFAGEPATAPASQFPTTVSGLAANTTGWVVALGGGKGLFVATDVAPLHDITPFYVYADPVSTTSIDPASPYWYGVAGIAHSIAVTPGQWRFNVRAGIRLKRSVDSGGSYLIVSVDGQQFNAMDIYSTPKTSFFYHNYAGSFVVNATTSRSVDIRVGFSGASTAATTSGFLPELTCTYQRIGEPT